MSKLLVSVIGIIILMIPSLHVQAQDSKQIPKGELIRVPILDEEIAGLKGKQFDQRNATERFIFEEDFETGAQEWEKEGTWEVGEPESGPGEAFNSVSVAGTNLTENYPNNANDVLISPLIELPDVSEKRNISLRFREWFEIESGYDYGYLDISTDNGQSWTTLNSSDGHSEWRQTEVDLTSYAGEDIYLRFRLSSDNFISFSGWYIDDVTITEYALSPLNSEITSINSQNFPNIYANIRIDSSGVGFPDLTQDDFTVYENSTIQTNLFNVTPPQEGGGVRRADIIFLMDNSGSMSEEQDAVESNVFNFVDALAASNVDFSLGLVRYGANENSGDPIFEDNGSLTSDAGYFKNDVWLRNEIEGGDEPGYYAMTEAIGNASFRPGAQRIFIIITDETPNQGGASQIDALEALEDGSTTLFALTESSLYHHFDPLTTVTGGDVFNIYSPFSDILDYIAEEVASSYVVSYRSDNPEFDGIIRTVRIEVNYEGNTSFDEATYIPGAAPSIQRTEETIALSDEGRPEEVPLSIEAEITDDESPDVQRAQLFYKNTLNPESAYISVDMTNTSGNIYQAEIPADAVVTPGIDYYITATDGNTTSSSPRTNPGATPFNIAVLPNEPPTIEHTPVTEATAIDQPIDIAFNATDNTRELERVKLHYRRTGQLKYEVEIFEDFINQSDFLFTIPAEFVTNDGVEYYIEAEDDWGVASTLPKEDAVDEPYSVSTVQPRIRLTDIYVKRVGENNFKRFEPANVVSEKSGSKIRFSGIVTDQTGNPFPNMQVRIYNSFRYNPDDKKNGIEIVETGSEGKFFYPSVNGSIETDPTEAGVRPFWFNVKGTNEAMPFALHLHNESLTVEAINSNLAKMVVDNPVIESAKLDTSSWGPFSDLGFSGQSYPTDDNNLNSSANRGFFLYYATNYVGPADEDFLWRTAVSSSSSRKEKCFSANQELQPWLNCGLNSFLEGFGNTLERTANLIRPVSEPLDFLVSPYIAEGALCIAGGAIGGVPGLVTCKPLLFHFNADFAIPKITRLGCETAAIEGKIEQSKCQPLEQLTQSGLGLISTVLPSTPGVPDVLSDVANLSTRAKMLNNVELVNDLVGVIEGTSNTIEAGFEFGGNGQGNIRTWNLLDVIFEPTSTSTNYTINNTNKRLNFKFTRPFWPHLTSFRAEFDDLQNPNYLNISIESSKLLFKTGTTRETTPEVRIGGQNFSMEKIDNGRKFPNYETEIPVINLPNFNSSNPKKWSESIVITGHSLETVQGKTTGSFTGLAPKTYTLNLDSTFTANEKDLSLKNEVKRKGEPNTAKLIFENNSFGGRVVFVSLSIVSFSQFANSDQPELQTLSTTINIESEGRTFTKPAELTIALDQVENGIEANGLGIYKRDNNGVWNRLKSEVDFSESSASTKITGPGYFAVLTGGDVDNKEEDEISDDIFLNQNYPNPFSQATTISYTLPEPQHITITIYDILGRKVSTLVDEQQEARRYRILFDARNLGLVSGIYLYRLTTENDQQTEKMMFIR